MLEPFGHRSHKDEILLLLFFMPSRMMTNVFLMYKLTWSILYNAHHHVSNIYHNMYKMKSKLLTVGTNCLQNLSRKISRLNHMRFTHIYLNETHKQDEHMTGFGTFLCVIQVF